MNVLRSMGKPLALTVGLMAAGAAAGRPEDPEYYRSLRQVPTRHRRPPSGRAWAIAKLGWSVATIRAARSVEGLTVSVCSRSPQ